MLGSTVPVRGHVPDETAVDVLVRPEALTMLVRPEALTHGGRGERQRDRDDQDLPRLGDPVGVQLSGDVAVRIDRPSAEAAALAPGASVSVALPAQPVLVAPRR